MSSFALLSIPLGAAQLFQLPQAPISLSSVRPVDIEGLILRCIDEKIFKIEWFDNHNDESFTPEAHRDLSVR